MSSGAAVITVRCAYGMARVGHPGEPDEPTKRRGRDGMGAVVVRAVRGDVQATDELLAYVHPLVLRYCRARLGAGCARHHVDDARPGGLPRRAVRAAALPRQGAPVRGLRLRHRRAQGGRPAAGRDARPRLDGDAARECRSCPTSRSGPRSARCSAATPPDARAARPPARRISASCCCCGSRSDFRRGDRVGARHVAGRGPGRPAPRAERLRAARRAGPDAAAVDGARQARADPALTCERTGNP